MNQADISTDNSTAIPLAGDEVFEGVWEDCRHYGGVGVSAWADVASAAGGLEMEFSNDAMNVIETLSTSVGAGSGAFLRDEVPAKWVRVRYTNGPTLQSEFSLEMIKKYVDVAKVAIEQPDGEAIPVSGTVEATQGTSPWVVSVQAPAPTKRYEWAPGNGLQRAVFEPLLSILNPAASAPIQVYRIRTVKYSQAARVGLGLGWIRIIAHSGGTLVAATAIAHKLTSSPNPRLQIRRLPPAANITYPAVGSDWITIVGGSEVVTSNTSGPEYIWEAMDDDDRITLLAGEGLVFWAEPNFDVDDQWHISIAWEEE